MVILASSLLVFTIPIVLGLFLINQNSVIKLYTATYFIILFLINIYTEFRDIQLDSFSKPFVIAIPLICAICSFWNMNTYKQKPFYISLIMFSICVIEAFINNDMFVLYAYMEASMIPTIIMMHYCDEHRKFGPIYHYLVYSFISACIVLIGLIMIYNEVHTSNINDIYKIGINNKATLYTLFLGAAIKLPIWPFYYWLPTVHGKSATTCSILLASIVLKFSSLVLVRFVIPFLNISKYIYYAIAIGMFFASCQMCMQRNLKVIFAYSSIIHMGLYLFVILSDLNYNYSTFCLLQHSFSMIFAFLTTDLLKSNYHTLDLNKFKISNKVDLILLSICVFSLIGLPGTWGFISEIIAMISILKYSIAITIIVCISILISTSYSVYIYFTLFNSKLRNNTNVPEITIYQICGVLFIIFIIFIIGLFPHIWKFIY